jgi:hypothetical protein
LAASGLVAVVCATAEGPQLIRRVIEKRRVIKAKWVIKAMRIFMVCLRRRQPLPGDYAGHALPWVPHLPLHGVVRLYCQTCNSLWNQWRHERRRPFQEILTCPARAAPYSIGENQAIELWKGESPKYERSLKMFLLTRQVD